MPRISRALHATIRTEPSSQSQRDSRRSDGTPFAAELIAIPARYRSSGWTNSSRLRPVTSSRFQPSCASKAGFGPYSFTVASSQTPTRKIGIVFATVPAKSRSTSSSSSRWRRSVMSRPPQITLRTLPCSS